MDNESLIGAIIMALCCFGCGLTFFVIGYFAEKAKKPVNFWSGTSVPVEKVTDIPAYNHANAVMWKVYSVPYWLAGIFGCLGVIGDVYTMASAIILFLACFPGLFFLVWKYRKIEKRYIIK